METKTKQTTAKLPQVVAALSASGGGFSLGTALGWSAPAGPRLVSGDDHYFEITSNQFSWAASILTIGCALSCLPIGILMNKFGRKSTMLSLFVPLVIGWALVTWAQNFSMPVAGRFLIGFAGGAFCVSVPQYLAEVTEKEIRGRVGSLAGVLITSGILFVYIIGAFASLFLTNIICTIIPLVFSISFVFMPESPAYLVKVKQVETARKSFKWLRGSSYDPKQDIDELVIDANERKASKASFGQILGKRATQRALAIGFGLMLFQQLSGINIVNFYSTFIFEVSDMSFLISCLSSAILGCTNRNQCRFADNYYGNSSGCFMLRRRLVARQTWKESSSHDLHYLHDFDAICTWILFLFSRKQRRLC